MRGARFSFGQIFYNRNPTWQKLIRIKKEKIVTAKRNYINNVTQKNKIKKL